jgi:hypothetical protein
MLALNLQAHAEITVLKGLTNFFVNNKLTVTENTFKESDKTVCGKGEFRLEEYAEW